MSKRFGRKQKRKLNKHIHDQNEQIHKNDQRITKLQQKLEQASEWDKEIARILGPHSALRLDTSRITNRDLPPNMRVAGAMNLPDYVMPTTEVMDMTVTSYNLQKIFTEIRHDPQSFRNMIRLIAYDKTKGKCMSAMYVDDQYMHRNGMTERDIHWLAEDIARQLAYGMNKEYGHDDSN